MSRCEKQSCVIENERVLCWSLLDLISRFEPPFSDVPGASAEPNISQMLGAPHHSNFICHHPINIILNPHGQSLALIQRFHMHHRVNVPNSHSKPLS